MKAERTISLVAFVYNAYIFVTDLIAFFEIKNSIYKDLYVRIPFPWHVLTALIATIVSLAYWAYLRNKERKGEEAKFALAISLILLLLPQFLVVAVAGFSFSKSIYDQLGNIK